MIYLILATAIAVVLFAIARIGDWLMRNDDGEPLGELAMKALRQLRCLR